jgi:hypothetical protein
MPAPSGDNSAQFEPHLRDSLGGEVRCWKCGYNRSGKRDGPCAECGASQFRTAESDSDRMLHSVWDEPGLAPDVVRTAPPEETYAVWVEKKRASFSALDSWMVVLGIALTAGPMGVIGAFMGAAETGNAGVLSLVLFGPIVEELTKTAILAMLIERKPYLFRGSVQILLAAAAGGLAFAVIENFIYLNVYIENPSAMIVYWRWTVCVTLHTGCSLLVGVGLVKVWRAALVSKSRPNLAKGTAMLAAAIVIHGAYNAAAIAMEMAGVF